MNKPMLTAVCAACVVFAASCFAQTVAGVETRGPDGQQLVLLAEDAQYAAVLDDEHSVRSYRVKPLLDAQPHYDLVLSLQSTQPLSLSLFSKAGDKEAFLRIQLPAYANAALAHHIPLSMPVEAFSLELLGSGTARLSSVEVLPRFLGWSSTTTARLSSSLSARMDAQSGQPVQLDFPPPQDRALYLSIALAKTGTVRIHAEKTWTASLKAGSYLAVPAALLGTKAFSVQSDSVFLDCALFPAGGPMPADLYSLLAIGAQGKPYDLYRWDVLPHTLVLDFADYAVQDQFLKRLAFFAEKPGFRGRLATDAELAGLHAWNAHDYPVWTLCSFYKLALESGFNLNPQELELLDLLVRYGILVKNTSGSLSEGTGAIISIARESTPSLRFLFANHEASHALFFQDDAYRQLCQKLWDDMPKTVRQFWLLHLAWRKYDIEDDYLCVNELQAYLVQQAASDAGAYLQRSVFPRLIQAYPDTAQWLSSVQDEVIAHANTRLWMSTEYYV
ncbi:MAG TPA: hypothetical protein PLC54_05285, partial [Spirochaetales bacterium]|nr:hypothetical protein [Spirochaetales bacterium]